MNIQNPKRWFRVTLACLAVLLVTALAADAAVTRLKALQFQPGYAKPGTLVQGVIELSIPAPPGGIKVKLDKTFRCGGCGGEVVAEPDATIHMPAELYIPAGKTSGLFNVAVIEVNHPTTLVVTATLRDQKQTAMVQLME